VEAAFGERPEPERDRRRIQHDVDGDHGGGDDRNPQRSQVGAVPQQQQAQQVAVQRERDEKHREPDRDGVEQHRSQRHVVAELAVGDAGSRTDVLDDVAVGDERRQRARSAPVDQRCQPRNQRQPHDCDAEQHEVGVERQRVREQPLRACQQQGRAGDREHDRDGETTVRDRPIQEVFERVPVAKRPAQPSAVGRQPGGFLAHPFGAVSHGSAPRCRRG